MSNNNDNIPPPPNPAATAYETFVRDTPLVTRYILTSQFITYIISFIFDPSFAVANIPHFTIYKFELYRLVLSLLICPSLLNLIFTYLSFAEYGRRLEYGMGSTSFGALVLSIGIVTNIIFVLLSFIFYILSGNTGWLFGRSLGIWIILFGVISIECSQASITSKRSFFNVIQIPTRYYPFALLLFFSLLGGGGLDISYLISIAVGFAYGYGYLDKLKLDLSRCKQWEETILSNFVTREGWVIANDATGISIINNNNENEWASSSRGSDSSRSGIHSLFSGSGGNDGNTQEQQQQQQQDPSSPTNIGSNKVFASGGGRALGSATHRRSGTIDPRQARLQAIERRSGGGGGGGKGVATTATANSNSNSEDKRGEEQV